MEFVKVVHVSLAARRAATPGDRISFNLGSGHAYGRLLERYGRHGRLFRMRTETTEVVVPFRHIIGVVETFTMEGGAE
jgi:hypothetical protein